MTPSRKERLLQVLEQFKKLPPATNGLEAYKQFCELINHSEDVLWGKESWNPPRTFLDGSRTDRLYPIYPESFHPVQGFPGVTVLISKMEIVFISRYGAIEIQEKDPDDKYGTNNHFSERHHLCIFKKHDAYRDGVWHNKNKS